MLTALSHSFRPIWLARSYLVTGTIVLFCLLITSGKTPAHSQDIPTFKVVTIEYPPFLGSELEGYGTLFILLKEYASTHFKVPIAPDFIPPARAQKLIYTGEWCLTTYPPKDGDQDSFFVPLRREPIEIGLYRKRQPANAQPFKWNDLSELRGRTIAILRSNIKSRFHHDVTDAGLEIIYVETRQQAMELLLTGRIDYAMGDRHAQEALDDADASTLEFSQTYLIEANVGFHYRRSCAEQIFKKGKIPHLLTVPTSDDLIQ